MSDRIAVLQRGPDRAARHPGRALRAARPARSSPASSAPRTCSRATSRAQLVGRRRHVRDPPREDPAASRPTRRPGRRRRHLRRARAWSARWSTSAPSTHSVVELDAGATADRRRTRTPTAPSTPRSSVATDPSCSPGGATTSCPWAAPVGRAPTRRPLRRRQHEERPPRRRLDRRRPALRCWPLVTGCGTSSDGERRRTGQRRGFTPPDVPMKESLGDMEGEVNILAWPGYAEDGTTDKTVDWVTPFEKETGCQANVKYFGTSDEAVNLMKTGEYDVVSASGDASLRLIASRRRRAGQHRPAQELRRHRAVPQGPRLELRRRPDVRHPARLGRQPADVQHRRGQAGADELGRGLRRRLDVRRQGHGVRLADLHRRRRALPDEHQPDLGHQEPLRARRGPARGGGRPAEEAEGARLGVLVGLPQGGRRRSRPATR